jgi:hypothetical protein
MSLSPEASALVVDPVSSGGLYAPVLAELGVTAHLLDTERAAVALRSGPTPGALNWEHDFGADLDRLADWCRERRVGYVVTGSESCVELCDRLRERLDLHPRSDPGPFSRRWNKRDMAEATARAGVPTLPTLAVGPGEPLPDEAVRRLHADGALVVKPTVGAGSVDVRVVRSEAELHAAVTAIHASAGFFGDHPDALVQQLYPGERREYVVDTFSHGDEHEVVSVSRYDKRVSADGDFVYERIRWLAPDGAEARPVRDHAIEVLRALGVGIGAAHLEVMNGDRLGPRLIDFGARAHGAGQPMKSHRLTGTSHVHRECEFAASVLDPHRPAPAPRGEETLPAEGAIVFFSVDEISRCVRSPRPETLLQIDGVLDATIHAEEGETYLPTRSLLDSLRLGLAFVTAPSAGELEARCDEVRDRFAREFEPAA